MDGLIDIPHPGTKAAFQDDPLKSLDLRAVQFPSDKISIAGLRKLFPNRFDVGFSPEEPQPSFFWIGEGPLAVTFVANTLEYERLLVIHAMMEAQGTEQQFVNRFLKKDSTLEDVKDGLIKRYIGLDLASGEHQAEELIRSLERQGRDLSGKGGPGLN